MADAVDAVVGEITKKAMDVFTKKAVDVLFKFIFSVMGVLFMFIFCVMGVLFKFIGRHVGYVVCCKRYVQNLEDEEKTLEDVKKRVEELVDEARRNVEVIDAGVERWLKEVREKQREVSKLLEGKEGLGCLSIGLRYRLGRGGYKKEEDVIGLKRKGDDFVKQGSVGRPATPTASLDLYTDNYERFASRETVFKAIMEAFQDDGKYIIGIHGMPGIGKTRMAVEVAKQAKELELFEEIANSTISQTPDWEKIQQELADRLGLRFDTGMSRAGRADRLCQRLQSGKKILVILDDVWSQFNQRMEIGIPFGDRMKGCKILLTSRRQDVCSQMRAAKILHLGILHEHEAWSLLKTKVGESVETAELHKVAKEVCKECGGLPLAILAVGGALMERGKPEWNDALRQLRNAAANRIDEIEARVYNPIKLSYQNLEQPDAQSCFLHCSLFPEDAEISVDDLVWYGVGRRFLGSFDKIQEARDRVHVLVGTLKRSSLLLPGRDETLVKMHDVIRDVAISIGSRDKRYAFLVKNGIQRWPDEDKYEGCMAISLRFNSAHKLPDGLECPELRMLVMDFTEVTLDDPFLKVPNNFFKGMEKLEVLDLTISYVLTLTSSFQNLVNLRMLRLTRCKLESLSIFNELHKLEILCLRSCIIEKSPRSSTDSIEPTMEVGKLICLKILDLGLSRGLDVLPKGFISNLSCLEELYIYDFDGRMIEGNAIFIELNLLTCLSTLEIHISDVTLLPEGLRVEALNRFKISIGSQFNYQDDKYNNSISRALKLEGNPLKVEFNPLIEKAQALSFIEVNGLEKVLHDKDFSRLEYLKVDRCNSMEHLLGKAKQNSQTSSTSLSKLRVLRVLGCSVKYLFPTSIGKGLQQLQKLCVESCERMEGIIGGSDNEESVHSIIFNGLKKLKLKDLRKFKSICADMKQGSSTECSTSTGNATLPLFNAKLELVNLPNLKSVFAKTGKMSSQSTNALPLFDAKISFPNLEYLSIERLDSITSFGVVISNQQLQKLTVISCEKLEELIALESDDKGEEAIDDEILPFTRLQEIRLHNLPNLQRLFYCCDSKVKEKNERDDHGSHTALFSKVLFPALEVLEIIGLSSITVICKEQLFPMGMEATHAQLCSFNKLRLLRVDGNCSLKYLFSPSAATLFHQLKELRVTNCESLETIIGEDVENPIIFHQLEKMELVNLPILKSVLAKTGKMSSQSTNALPLFDAKVLFPALVELEIIGLSSITVVCKEQLFPMGLEATHAQLCSFNKLRLLRVDGNCRLKYLFSPSAATLFHQLKELRVTNCESLETIIGEDVENPIIFHQLEKMELVNLPILKSVLAKTGKMSSQSTNALPLFDAKVLFPALVELEISKLNSITVICKEQLFPMGMEATHAQLCSFNKLWFLRVYWNCRLKYLFSPSAATLFHQLKELFVKNCESLETIIGEDAENAMDPIIFHQLKELELVNLPNLKSVLANTGKMSSQSTNAPPLFDAKISFPNLEYLSIERLDCITSFGVVISNRQLQGLTVISCEKLEELIAIGSDDKGEEVFDDKILPFTQLWKVRLHNLPNLQRLFYSCDSEVKEKNERDDHRSHNALFSKVLFPALEVLEIIGLNSITVICKEQLFPMGLEATHGQLCSFNKLRFLRVYGNCRLKYLFSPSAATLFHQLKELCVKNCESLETIIGKDVENAMDPIIFHQLKELELENLPVLKSVLANTGKMSSQSTNAPPLFDAKVLFPALEVLEIIGLDSITVICKEQLFPMGLEAMHSQLCSFNKLRELRIDGNCRLKYLFSPSVATLFHQQFQELCVKNCESLETIIGKDVENAMDPIIFHQLKELELVNLPVLKSVLANTGKMSSQSTNAPPLFDAKVQFPSLERMEISGLDLITVIWDEQLRSILTETSQDRLCAFRNLRHLTVSRNCKLKYLFSLSIARCLRQLFYLIVKNCESMEAIIGDEEEVIDSITFHELERLEMENLPNLKSFYANTKKMSSSEGSPCTTVTPLFNVKVQFPSLERMEISGLDLITAIWDEQLRSILTETSQDRLCAFRNLRHLTVSRNCKLKYLFSLSIARCLRQLFYLIVKNCESMEAIIGDEEEVMDSITFHELERLEMENLPNLKSFYANTKKMSSSEGSPCTTVTPLFNVKVSFPVLTRLEIYGLKCIMSINQLHSVKNKLRDSFPQLETLYVRNCENIEMIVVVEMEARGGEAIENDIVLFPQLTSMTLEDLSNLKSFWGTCASKDEEIVEEALFKLNRSVKIPHFERLNIKGVDKLKEIWHSTVISDSVSNLTTLKVQGCANLLNVGPLKLLGSVVHSLQELKVIKCPSLQDVFKIEVSKVTVEDERVEKEEGVTAGGESSDVFYQLRSLGLPSLDLLPPFARGKDSFPELYELSMSEGSMLEETWEGRVPFVGKVRVLNLEECSQLVNDVPWVDLLQRFEAVKKLNITSCSSLQVAFSLQGLDDDAIESLAAASSQVEELTLKDLPELEHMWMEYYPKGPVVFSSLTWLTIECCNKLKYLFSISTANALTQLQCLCIDKCDGLEEIVVIEGGQEDIAAEEIVFPQLLYLQFRNLMKLTSFCGANNIAFKFPSLLHVGIRECPKLFTFTCGATEARKVSVSSDIDDIPMDGCDINAYVRLYARKMKILAADNHHP